jgi:hypothetical protein
MESSPCFRGVVNPQDAAVQRAALLLIETLGRNYQTDNSDPLLRNLLSLTHRLIEATRLKDEEKCSQLIDLAGEQSRYIVDHVISKLAFDYETNPFPLDHLKMLLNLAESRKLLTSEVLCNHISLAQHPEITAILLSYVKVDPKSSALKQQLGNALLFSLGIPEIGKMLLRFDSRLRRCCVNSYG